MGQISLVVAVIAVAVAAVCARAAARSRAALRAVEDVRDRPAPEPAVGVPDPERLSAALDATRLAVVVTAAGGAVEYRNRAAVELLSAHDHRVLVRDALEQTLDAASVDGPVERQVDLFGPPASTFVIRVDPLDRGTRVGSGLVAVVEDVSERRRLEQVRRDFVANVSHELKTPVGAVSLLAETLVAEAAGGEGADPDVVLRLAGRMAHEMGRLARTVDDLLELSRIESGDDLELEPVRLGDVVDEAVERLAAAAEARSVRVAVEGPRRVVVPGDRRQLTSAIANLLDNAVKYSPVDTTVTVRIATDEGEAAVSVTDEGIGIPPRDLVRVFERFYRVDGGRSRDTGGTGLGLSIVRHIAANHGGRVEVESREGVGSCFTLRLPSLDAPERTGALAATDEGGAP